MLSLIIISFLSSCNKSNSKDAQGLIFGTYAGECFGDGCVRIFKLTEDEVWEDQNHYLPGTTFSGEQFDFERLPNSKFELVKGFEKDFPMALLDEKENQIGCPDCYDQGGCYVEWNDNGSIRNWTIDNRKEEVPEYLHEFKDLLSKNIKLLKE